MKKIILAIIVFIIVFAFTLPLYATDKDDIAWKGTKAVKGSTVGYWSSAVIKQGQDFYYGSPAGGSRGVEIQELLGHY